MRNALLTFAASLALCQTAVGITILSQSAEMRVELGDNYDYDPDSCPWPPPVWPERTEFATSDLRDFNNEIRPVDPVWGSIARVDLRSEITADSITFDGFGSAGGADTDCGTASSDVYLDVTIEFRLPTARNIEVSGVAWNRNIDCEVGCINADGASISIRGPENARLYWKSIPGREGYGEVHHYHVIREYCPDYTDYYPPWPAGDYMIHAQLELNGMGGVYTNVDRGGIELSIIEVVPEPGSLLLAGAAAAIFAVAARRRGPRRIPLFSV